MTKSKNDYKIAVLLPTRARTDALKLSVISIVNRVVDINGVQILFGFDNDDEIGLGYFSTDIQPWLEEKGAHYTVVLFEPKGYQGLNLYYNGLAQQASADWFFVWNDDALMETTGWDKVVKSYDGQFKLLKVHTHREHPYSIFPIYPKAWYDLFNFMSRHQMVDAELSQEAYMLDLMEIVDIYVTHDRHDITGNNNDATQKAKVTFEGNPSDPRDFHNPRYGNARVQDCEVIATYLKSVGQDISYWEKVKTGQIDPWEKLRANDPNNQMRQFKMSVQ
jgi:hypothetical protein